MSGKNKYQSISYDLSFDHDDQTDIINQRVLGLYNRSNKRSRLTDDHQLNRPDNINPEGIINNQPESGPCQQQGFRINAHSQKGHHQSQDQSNSSLLRSAADNANPSNDNLNLRLNKQRQPITRSAAACNLCRAQKIEILKYFFCIVSLFLYFFKTR
ncbi:expressed protein [Phakopsora pachyrhizi]|uniref:Expressed protein n=1 Tax=Phakopsora pachyrhizi TaxID=170000 RepID=A0AAV0AWV8_PHAPC|nr:expressed protein [Phakopsora pachyrhizi]